MKEEKGLIHFGSRNIPFSVKRSRRRKTVSIFVDPFEGVFLRSPFNLPIKALSKLVHSKAVWILEKQRRMEEIKEFLPKRDFVSGESYSYLGRRLRLRIISLKDFPKPTVIAKESRFWVKLNGHYTKLGRKRVVRNVLIQWYKHRAYNLLISRAKIYADKFEVSYKKLILANQSKRWGSCSHKGIVRINWHIIMSPMSLIDYVVAHELCHLKHKNHSHDYWKLLGTIMPDYESRRDRLRKEGQKYYL